MQGVTDYEPRVVNQLLNFVYRHVADILLDAEVHFLSETFALHLSGIL